MKSKVIEFFKTKKRLIQELEAATIRYKDAEIHIEYVNEKIERLTKHLDNALSIIQDENRANAKKLAIALASNPNTPEKCLKDMYDYVMNGKGVIRDDLIHPKDDTNTGTDDLFEKYLKDSGRLL